MTHFLVQLRTAIHNKNSREISRIVYRIKEACLDDSFLKTLIMICLDEIGDLLALNKYDQAYDLVDAIHALPNIIKSSNRDMTSYWQDFIIPYSSKWSSNFFDKYKDEIINI